jgi:hypothetical protein
MAFSSPLILSATITSRFFCSIESSKSYTNSITIGLGFVTVVKLDSYFPYFIRAELSIA